MGRENGAGAAGTLTVLFTTLGQSHRSRAENRKHRCGAIRRVVFATMLGVTIKQNFPV